MNLEIVSLIIMIVVVLILFYAIIAVHDVPYVIAKKRNHPHKQAIHYAGWVSMFTLHAIWPFLWIWATVYHPEKGYGFTEGSGNTGNSDETAALKKRIDKLEKKLDILTADIKLKGE